MPLWRATKLSHIVIQHIALYNTNTRQQTNLQALLHICMQYFSSCKYQCNGHTSEFGDGLGFDKFPMGKNIKN